MERLYVGRPAPIPYANEVPSNWSEGFAVLPGFGDTAHYFRRDAPRVCSIDGVMTMITPVISACGHTRFEFKTTKLRQVGNFPECGHCALSKGEK